QRDKARPPLCRGQPESRWQELAKSQRGMVTQIAADTSQSDRDLDAERAKRGRRTNAGPHQHRGRLDGACRHDHAARADENALAIPKDANTLSALAIHDE